LIDKIQKIKDHILIVKYIVKKDMMPKKENNIIKIIYIPVKRIIDKISKKFGKVLFSGMISMVLESL
jgi:hypothetical protein